MIRLPFVFFLVSLSLFVPAQDFTWMKGTNTGGQTGLYGTQGVASSTNNPGCRHGSATWVDTQGNLWMFGGEGYSTNNTLCWLNDLWKYDILTNQWTWISGANTANQPGVYGTQGVPSSLNHPGAREFMLSWTDASGNFWLFGGDGFDSNTNFGKLGDLWRYNPATNQWTWMKGFNAVDQNGTYGSLGIANAANIPGCRSSSGSWIDGAGNLWLFGGRGLPAAGTSIGFLNDLWKYSISTNQWTWENGSNLISQPCVYGTLNTSAVGNTPGGTEFTSCWANGNDLYLFGGRGLPGTGPISYLNTFWKYSISLNQWTWIGGSNSIMAIGVYGTLGLPSATNVPGARMSAAAWNDGAGNLWLFGGEGNSANPGLGALNDMFRYTISNGNWTWIKGSNSIDQQGTYGTQTVSATGNVPGGRYYNTWWPISNGRCWLMGGFGYANSSTPDNMEDLWKFYPSCNPESLSVSPSATICAGQQLTLTTQYTGTNTVLWYTSAIGGTAIGSGTQIVTPTLQAVAVNSVYTFYSESAGCSAYPRTATSMTVAPSPTIILSPSNPICSGEVYTCWTSGTAVSFTWSNGSNSSVLSVSLTANTTFTVIGSGLNGCIGQRTITALVMPLPTVNIVGNTTLCAGGNAVLNVSGSATSYTWNTGSNSNSIMVTPASSSTYNVIGEDANNCQNTSTHTITVFQLPLVSIQSKSVICNGEQVVLSGNGALSYSWSTGQSTASISVSPSTSTTYSVVGTAANTCTNSAHVSLTVHPCVGLEDQSADNNSLLFSVFPNPSTGTVYLQTSRLKSGKISIYNALGQEVYSKVVDTELTEVSLSKGVYICRLRSEHHSAKSLKLVVD